jgi:peptide/histidine transporter 3/4
MDAGSHEPMNKMDWVAAIPNYVLVALAECLINVTSYDVFYNEVPMDLKSTCQALNLFMVAMGSNVTSIFTLLFQEFIPQNLNDGHLEYM